MEKYLSKLVEISLALMEGNRVSHPYHVSFIFDKSRIISIGINDRKRTHPQIRKFKYIGRQGEDISDKVTLHAEMVSCLKLGLDYDFSKLKIVNLRFKKDKTLGNSRPCSGCSHLIEQLGFKEVWYTDTEGRLVLYSG